MKRTLAFLLIVSAMLLCLVSCQKEENNADTTYAPGQTFTIAETTAKAPEIQVTPGTADYDGEGNLILTSTDNRYVYKKDSGYIIFTFNASTNTCYQVLDVKEFDSEDSALQYMKENVVEQMGSGEYANVVNNGKYVVLTATLNHSVYGEYLKGNRQTVEKIFPDDLKVK